MRMLAFIAKWAENIKQGGADFGISRRVGQIKDTVDKKQRRLFCVLKEIYVVCTYDHWGDKEKGESIKWKKVYKIIYVTT